MSEDSAIEGVLEHLPHKGTMLFLDELVSVGEDNVVTRTRLTDDFLLMEDGRCSSLVAIELFAQSAAALMTWRARNLKDSQVTGALLGSRKMACEVGFLKSGDVVRTEATEVWGAGQLAQFDCKLWREGGEDELIASGVINVVSGPVP